MYIIVRHKDNVIVGSAVKPIDEIQLSKTGFKVFQIDDKDFSPEMLGKKLDGFEEVKNDSL